MGRWFRWSRRSTADEIQVHRKRTFEKYIAYARRHIKTLIAPVLLADVQTVPATYLPYLLEGYSEEPH